MARVGLLGGTFNPPHIGHLVCALEACAQLALDVVRLVPVHAPPHKVVVDDPGPDVRAHLCELAVAENARLEVSRVEIEREPPSFTVDTLRELNAQAPEDELTFIVGGDMAHSLPMWREPDAILDLARLAVASREGIGRPDVLERLEVLAGAAGRVDFFDMPRLDVASSDIRRRVAAGRPIRYLVPDPVAAEIAARRLYA